MLPRVNVRVTEQPTGVFNTLVPFVPAIIMKTKSGPIGSVEEITSEAAFKSMFGDSDTTVPSAYGIQTYLRSYSKVYVVRVADDDVKIGTVNFSLTNGTDTKECGVFNTEYLTDIYNNTKISLVLDSENNKIYFDIVYPDNRTVSTVKFNFDNAAGETADKVQAYRDLVSAFNSSNLGITFTDTLSDEDATTLFGKALTAPDPVVIAGGNSGNTGTLEDETYITAIEAINKLDLDLDALIVPESTSQVVAAKAMEVASAGSYMFFADVSGDDAQDILTKADAYPESDSLALYAPSVYYNNFDAPIPASVAVLTAFARNDSRNKWSAPAGTNRALLPLVTSLVTPLSVEDMSTLYDNSIPVNCIRYISGTGYALWGQKTTASSTTYLDRINVSRLVKYCTKQIYELSYQFLFEPITEQLFADWTLQTQQFLENLVAGSAIDEFFVKMDSDNNTEETIRKNQLIGLVRIKPTEVAEFIDIDFVITDEVNQ